MAINSLKILHIVHSLKTGGLERIVIDLSKGLINRGHFVEVFCLAEKGRLGDEAEKSGIKVSSFGKISGKDWALPLRLAKEIKKKKFNIIHTHNEAGMVYGISAAIFNKKCKCIHTEHGNELEYKKKKALKIIEKILLRKANYIIFVSKTIESEKVKKSNALRIKSNVIVNGIDVDKYFRPEMRECTRKELGISNDIFVIGAIGRLVTLKNHIFLLKVFKELVNFTKANKSMGIELIIVGDGPLRRELEIKAVELGISKIVRLLGERNDIPSILAAMDLFVLPSLTEGLSVSLLEALAAGKAVIASDVAGNSKIIEHNKNGILISTENISNWINEIIFLIENRDRCIKFAREGRNHVREKFSLNNMVDLYEKLYFDAINYFS